MFSGKERKRIAELEAEWADEQEVIAAFRHELLAVSEAKTKADRDALAEMAKVLREQELVVAGLNGQIEALKDKGAKYDALVQGHIFHSGGAVEIDAKSYRLMEAHTDNPLANMRVLVPEGVQFP